MPANFTPRQLEFYRDLFAPFLDCELSEKPGRGGKTFTFIDKRALMNRLDSVCGPAGWKQEYRPIGDGLICALSIKVPTIYDTPDVKVSWEWITKEDGAGPEEMSELDNDIKSKFTNALRRSAQDAWGIGRYLYQKGIPDFLDPNAVAPQKSQAQTELRNPTTAPASEHKQVRSVKELVPVRLEPTATPTLTPAPTADISLPKAGTNVWSWAKNLETHFETQVTNGMLQASERMGFSKIVRDWNEEQTLKVCMDVVAFIRNLPTYKGQFEHLFAKESAAPAPLPPKAEKSPSESKEESEYKAKLVDAKRSLMNSMHALVEKQIGRKAENAELGEALRKISPVVANEHGHKGEECQSLSKCDDIDWVRNMTAFVMKQIEAAQAAPPDDDIPF